VTLPWVGCLKSVDQADQRRLAGAALADHADNGTFGNDEVDGVDRLHLGGILPRREDLADTIEGDDGTPLVGQDLADRELARALRSAWTGERSLNDVSAQL
jgi:hypothetical protein